MADEHRIKSIEELTFTDDFMFGAVMKDPAICAKVIERLLGIKVAKVEYPELQKHLTPLYLGKGVRFDVYLSDSERIYEIEMQTYRMSSIGRRIRYYQSLMDANALMRGADYGELKESYVLFLCTFDPFGKGLPVYSFELCCLEDGRLTLGDMEHCRIFNCPAFEREEDPGMRAFLEFMARNKASDGLTEEIAKMVEVAKFEQTFINEYLARRQHENDVKKLGREEGIEIGIEKGEHTNAVASAKNLLAMGLGTHEQVAQAVGLTLAEVEELAAQK